MTRHRQMLSLLALLFIAAAVVLGYFLWQRYAIKPFSCQANLVQHHKDEKVSLWLNYRFDGKSGTLSMNGRLQSKPDSIIDRKISFRVARKDNVWLLTSENNLTFPGDNVADRLLGKYEPQFFVYPGKSIYIRINEQQNDNYIFTLGTLPTYVCRSTKNE